MSAMRMPLEPRPGRPTTDADDDRPDHRAGEMPGEGGAPTDALPRFGGRLAGLGPLGAPALGDMPGGDMNGGLAALLGDLPTGSDVLDRPPAEGAADMPTGAMDDPRGEADGGAMLAAMNEGRTDMPTGRMTTGDGTMPAAGALRRREDPDAGGEVRRAMPADDGGEIGAAPFAGAGGMPSADMHRGPAAATGAEAGAAPATTLALGGEWRLTLSSISLGRGG
jgi:hypothetical protein